MASKQKLDRDFIPPRLMPIIRVRCIPKKEIGTAEMRGLKIKPPFVTKIL